MSSLPTALIRRRYRAYFNHLFQNYRTSLATGLKKTCTSKLLEAQKKGEDKDTLAVHSLTKNLADSMGETFNSDYRVETMESSQTVTLDRCGCIESVLKTAETYDMSQVQAKSIFCGACMSGYRKAAHALDIGFNGKLSEKGCTMSFSENKA